MIEARRLLQGMVDSPTLPIAYRNAALDVLHGRLPFANGEPAADDYPSFLVGAVALIAEYRALFGGLK